MKTVLNYMQPGILFLALTWICLFIVSVSRQVEAAEFNLEILTKRKNSLSRSKVKPHFKRDSDTVDTDYQPSFDNTTQTDVTAILGETAYLYCRIHQLGFHSVIWKKGDEFLAIDRVIIRNERFTPIHYGGSVDWILQIRYVQKRDAGLYECLISTDPPVSRYVTLDVIVPKAAIQEGANLSIESGNTITLTCIISESAYLPSYSGIFWYMDGQLLNYDTSRDISIEVEKGSDTVSRLQILNAHSSDSGNYTCAPSNADSASITVQVRNAAEFNLETFTKRENSFSRSKVKPNFKRDLETVDADYQPSFDNTTTTNVTALSGETAYLFCRIHQLGFYSVAWKKGYEVITINLYIIRKDQRFTPIHSDGSADWILQIRHVQNSDAGLYECVINTDPPVSRYVTLNVIVPKAAIQEGAKLSIESGNTLTLTCIISDSAYLPSYVFWYMDGQLLNYDTSRGISIEVEKDSTTVSRLQILNARSSDSGNYTCAPSNADSASITVQVLNEFNTTGTNTTAQLGETAYLYCRIHQSGSYIVSWIRISDLTVVAIGHYAFDNSQKYTPILSNNSEYWILQIHHVQRRDAGLYECRMGTSPSVSHFVTLNIIVPKATILEGSNIDIRSGNPLSLTCEIRETPTPPTYIFWYRDDQLISFDSSIEGISIQVEYGSTTTSRLQITNAHGYDSGNYTCAPSNADSASITVRVLNVM